MFWLMGIVLATIAHPIKEDLDSKLVLYIFRRFSIMPGTRVDESVQPRDANRRQSIIPKSQQPTTIARKQQHPLGFQYFEI